MEDIVDEALVLFRANILFRNFEPQGGGDRVLMYLLLFIAQVSTTAADARSHGDVSLNVCNVQCLKKVEKKGKDDAARELNALATGQHFIPGDNGWPLGSLLPIPKTGADQETLRSYFRQLREALVIRLIDRLYGGEGATAAPNKHWMMFSKRKFMGKEFP